MNHIFEKTYIELSSPTYMIKSWEVDSEGNVWKTNAPYWKDLLPGDWFIIESILDFPFCLDKVVFKAYRGSQKLFEIYVTPNKVSRMLKHFDIIKNK